jgi:protein MpaA
MTARWAKHRWGIAGGTAAASAAVIWLIAGGQAERSHGRLQSGRVRVGAPARPGPRAQTFVIGRSVEGRRIRATALDPGGAKRTVLVVGCIHGNEPAGIAIARRLELQRPPPKSALWIVPVLNPDGVAARQRQNAHGVDLNRNFSWHWRPLGVRGDVQYSGPHPLSEPESRAIRRLILRVRPQITIWFHQPLGVVDLSGGSARIERRFARLSGLRARRLTRYPGSAVSWGNSVLPGNTSFVVELPPGLLSAATLARFTRAVLALARPAVSP